MNRDLVDPAGRARTLFGKRLLVARPAAQAPATARLIRHRGAEPVTIPLVSIEDPADPAAVRLAARSLGTYDWVLLTSANGAGRLLLALEAEKLDAKAFGSARIAVIGPETAEPLRRFRIHADLVAEEHCAEGLLRDLLAHGRMRRVLFFGAELARHLVPDHLRAEGVAVDVVAAYRTRRLGAEQAASLTEALSNRQLNAVLVTSSSIATALFEALGTNAHSLLRNVAIASIGPVTSATLERLGAEVSVTSRVFTISALLDALEQYYTALADGDVHRQPTT